MGTSNSIYYQSSGTEMAERQNRSSTLTRVTAAVAVPILLQETLCVLEAVFSQSIVCWKSTQSSGLHFIYIKNSAFLLQQRGERRKLQ